MDDERGYHNIEHTADLAIEAWAPTLEALFAVATEAMFEQMGSPRGCLRRETITCESEGVDLEDLLVSALSDRLADLEISGRFCHRVTCLAVTRRGDGWTSTLRCECSILPEDGEQELAEIKAVTYHDIAVVQDAQGCFARLVFDV